MPFVSQKQRKWMLESIVDRAYLAGAIDGEGCIRIFHGKNGRNTNWIRHRAFLQVTNTNRILPDWCKLITGMGFVRAIKPKNHKWKTRYDWIVQDGNAIDVIEAVLPYLKLKHSHASLLRDWFYGNEETLNAVTLFNTLNQKGNAVQV
ncbi:MAG: hypothetical protein A4E53_01731 [Pelotomaculum sp. PtaB.Bin104]|nr:MAG: hypothetical protein A4E53_01731 [Pelotomaculum sp. PtaB.Bin104]